MVYTRALCNLLLLLSTYKHYGVILFIMFQYKAKTEKEWKSKEKRYEEMSNKVDGLEVSDNTLLTRLLLVIATVCCIGSASKINNTVFDARIYRYLYSL